MPARRVEVADCHVGRMPADDKKRVYVIAFDGAAQRVVLFRFRNGTARPEDGTPIKGPSFDCFPVQRADTLIDEAVPRALNTQHFPTTIQAKPNRGTNGGVHSGCQAARMQNRNALGLLPVFGQLWWRGEREKDIPHLVIASAASTPSSDVLPLFDESSNSLRVLNRLFEG